MMQLLKSLLQSPDPSRRLTDNPPPPEVAVCALLLEAAETDHDFTEDERRLIAGQIHAHFGLSDQEIVDLIAETQKMRVMAGDSWPFTHAIRRAYSPAQKKELLVAIWRVLLSDKKLTAHEEQWARRLRDMIAVNQSTLMEAKRMAAKPAKKG